VGQVKPFAILRDIPPELTWDEMDAAAIQNMINMGISEAERDIAWEPRVLGVKWVRTYWEQGSNWATCLYTAPDEQAVRDWHDLCQVNYAGIRDVEVEEAPEAEGEYPRGFHATAEGAPLVVIEATAPGARPSDGWIRTYRLADSGEEILLFRADALPAAAPTTGRVRRVVELRPEDYS
jgi:hypothetical protein